MQRILRLLAPLALLLAAMALVACGGDDSKDTGGTAVKTDDAQEILKQTFGQGNKKVESGKVELTAKIDASGAGTESLQGPVDVKLSGPFQSEGKGKVPQFDMDFEFNGAGQNIKGSATSTGDKGFVGFNGQDYAVDDATFKQFTQGYLESQKNSGGLTLADLRKAGVSPEEWFQDPKVDGDSSVGGTDTVKVSGPIDLDKMLADVNVLLEKAPSLGIPNSGTLPSKLTSEQIDQVKKAVKSSNVEIETGKDDSILRRLAATLSIEDPAGSGGKADIDFEISLSDLGESQDIKAPSDTKPLNDLLGSLGGLGALGGLGSSGGGGSSSGGATSGVDKDAAEKYTQCIQDAGSDTAKLQDCADLLGG